LETLGKLARDRLSQDPNAVAVIDGDVRLSRMELYSSALRLGSALVRRGLKPGSVVSFQLPNWHEACVINLACALFGLVVNPLLPMYRERDLSFILNQLRCDAIFIPDMFRDVDFGTLLDRTQFETKRDERVFRVRSKRADVPTYDDLVQESGEPIEPSDVDPGSAKLVIYTSGSTGRPKGVIHSHFTIHATVRQGADFWGMGEADKLFIPSPIGHIGGSIYAFEFPWITGATAILTDTWDPQAAVHEIDREGASFLAGATPFLQGLLGAALEAGSRLPSLRRFVCGGASVSSDLIGKAQAHFPNAIISRAYGSSEIPIICPGVRSRSDAFYGMTTDGAIMADVLILDPDGKPLPAGATGDIVARSPRMFVGYVDSGDEAGQFTDGGYFRMGDVGRIVDDRFLEITGRKKEIIIRNGENISPREIENALLAHEAISQVAVVGVPDVRTGERAAAFVVLRPACNLTFDQLRSFLTASGVARQKFPEELHVLDQLPVNSIGKVIKEELRSERSRAAAQSSTGRP
jgi:acyl-CoA synthetase (AMP-forming)/AMP-acid ligase II